MADGDIWPGLLQSGDSSHAWGSEGPLRLAPAGVMRLLVFNLAMDLDNSMLGFTTRWVAGLAKLAERVEVITMTRGRGEVPANVGVHSVGRERGWSKPRRVGEFYRVLSGLLRRGSVDACFSHMMPLFSALGGPLLKVHGIPLITWYAHPSLTWTLRAAHACSDRMVTSLPRAYPYKHDKLEVIGQGIDTELFNPGGGQVDHPPLILCVGRLSPVKNHAALLRAAAVIRARRPGLAFQVAILGEAVPPHGAAYMAKLRTLVAELELDGVVRFEPALPATSLPMWYGRATVHVNLTPAGFGDKVALEAMACARPSLVANEDLLEVLGAHAPMLSFPHDDPGALADRLEALLAVDSEQLNEMGTYLRHQVRRLHGLDQLVAKVYGLLDDLRRTT